MNPASHVASRSITIALLGLVGLDLVLTVWAGVFPSLWFQVFHGSPYIDPQALLRRCAGNWLAFLLLQSLAVGRWKREPWWLMLVAGCRLGDALTDITCLTFCQHATAFAYVAFPFAGAANVGIGLFLAREYLRWQRSRQSAETG